MQRVWEYEPENESNETFSKTVTDTEDFSMTESSRFPTTTVVMLLLQSEQTE